MGKIEQLSILGGLVDEGSGTCAAFSPCTLPGRHDDTCGGSDFIRNVSRSEAQAHVANGGHWCCDSCNEASWYY